MLSEGSGVTRRVKLHVRTLEPMSYVHDTTKKLREHGIEPEAVIDCSLGTNPYGCSPVVHAAASRLNWKTISDYPDPGYTDLKQALIAFWSDVVTLTPGQIFLGVGSMGVLEKVNKLLVGPGSRVLGYSPQFTSYISEVWASGGDYDYAALSPDKRFTFNATDILCRIGPECTMVYLDNPNNPTGQIISLADIETITAAAASFDVAVLVDEAYGDFMDKANSALKLTGKYGNLIVVRSFSKGSGLANLRVGYGVTQGPLLPFLEKVDMLFTFPSYVSRLAAISLRDETFIIDCRQRVAAAKQQVIAACRKLTIAKTDAEVPILTIGHPDPAVNLYEEFVKRGILTEAGEDFLALGKNYIRLRVPADIGPLLERLSKIQESL
ncbi:MAG: pyridoxal phosphate-dependent aminotransferase [bacterium]|jgi:histidinol-phosphate aminotransferase